jgi:two-component system sensor kinase FixL
VAGGGPAAAVEGPEDAWNSPRGSAVGKNQRRLVELVIAMAAVCLASAALGFYALYRATLQEQRRRLDDALEAHVRLIEAVARSRGSRSGGLPAEAERETLQQVLEAHRRSPGFGRTGEFVLARVEEGRVVFVVSQRTENPPPRPLSGPLDEPLRRALAGERGSCICVDDAGRTVLASYAPVPLLRLAAVAKIDLAEIRAPFLTAGAIGGAGAVVAIALSALLFVRFATPLIGSLEESEARNRAIIENAAEGIIAVGEDGLVEALNPAAAGIFGYEPSEAIGRPVSLLLPSPAPDRAGSDWPDRFGAVQLPGGPREVTGRRRGGEPCPVEIAVSEGAASGRRFFTVMVRDLTERKRSEAEREELRRAAEQNARLAEIGALSAKIVHDLGNPLGGLSMQAQLLHRYVARGESRERVLARLEEMMSTLRYMESLIGQFREFGRGRALEVQPIEVGSFLEEVVRVWQPQAARRGATLECEVAPGLPPLRADPAKLRRVLDNLIKNAIEACDALPAEVRLEARSPEPGRLRISVADSGPGMPESIRPFQLFETTKADGTGLGLAVSREIVLAHGGNIDWARREPRGTVFFVDLPVEGPAQPRAVARKG